MVGLPPAVECAGHGLRPCLEREHLVRTCTIAVLVGSWLTLFNQGDVMLATDLGPTLAAKVGLNYLTPFVVANLGLLSRRRDAEVAD